MQRKNYQTISFTTDHYRDDGQAFLQYCPVSHKACRQKSTYYSQTCARRQQRNRQLTTWRDTCERNSSTKAVTRGSTSGTDNSSGRVTTVLVLVVAVHPWSPTYISTATSFRFAEGRKGKKQVAAAAATKAQPDRRLRLHRSPRTQPVHVQLSKSMISPQDPQVPRGTFDRVAD